MKPILFNTEMVRAILDGRKTVTRRLVKPQPGCVYGGGNVELRRHKDGPHKGEWHCYRESPPLDKWANRPWGGRIDQPYQIGDILYVRETWANLNTEDYPSYFYKATDEMPDWALDKRWRPSIHMPKAAARIFLRVTDVYPQHLQDMTEDDVCAEGAEQIINFCEHMDFVVDPPEPCYNVNPCKDCFINYSSPELFGRMVWDDSIKKKDLPLYGWEANPWVWVIEFERVEATT